MSDAPFKGPLLQRLAQAVAGAWPTPETGRHPEPSPAAPPLFTPDMPGIISALSHIAAALSRSASANERTASAFEAALRLGWDYDITLANQPDTPEPSRRVPTEPLYIGDLGRDELIAAIERLEDEGATIPDDLYDRLGISPPTDRPRTGPDADETDALSDQEVQERLELSRSAEFESASDREDFADNRSDDPNDPDDDEPITAYSLADRS